MVKYIQKLFAYNLHRAYVELFNPESPQVRRVLTHMRSFCYANYDMHSERQTVFSNDPLELARRAGRQEVFNEIMKYIHMSDEDIANLRESN